MAQVGYSLGTTVYVREIDRGQEEGWTVPSSGKVPRGILHLGSISLLGMVYAG